MINQIFMKQAHNPLHSVAVKTEGTHICENLIVPMKRIYVHHSLCIKTIEHFQNTLHIRWTPFLWFFGYQRIGSFHKRGRMRVIIEVPVLVSVCKKIVKSHTADF